MKSLILIAFVAALSLASESATAQCSLTPLVSHSYEKIAFSSRIHNNIDQSNETFRGTEYFNSQRFDLEVAYAADTNLEWL